MNVIIVEPILADIILRFLTGFLVIFSVFFVGFVIYIIIYNYNCSKKTKDIPIKETVTFTSVCPYCNGKNYTYEWEKHVMGIINYSNPKCSVCGKWICPKCGSHNIFRDEVKSAQNPVLDYGEFSIYRDEDYECKDCKFTWDVRM
jgi:transposase-like protein